MSKPPPFEYFFEKPMNTYKSAQSIYRSANFLSFHPETHSKSPVRNILDPQLYSSQAIPLQNTYTGTNFRSKSPAYSSTTQANPLKLNESFAYTTRDPKLMSTGPISYDQFINPDKTLLNTLSTKTQTQKLTKQAQLLEFKQKAKEKEILMEKRKKSAIKIQKFIRGWLQRKKFIPLWERHLRKIKHLKLRAIAKRIKILFAPYKILRALKAWVLFRQKEKQQIMEMFREYSAIYIQKVWRGFKVKKAYEIVVSERSRAKCYILALVKGWKVRKIMKSRDIQYLIAGITELTSLKNELLDSEQNLSLITQVSGHIPLTKIKLIREIQKLYRTATYIKPQGPAHKASILETFMSAYEKKEKLLASIPQETQSFLITEKPSPIKSREDEPVKTAENPEEPEFIELDKPKKTFKNFLRRGQNAKYNPKTTTTKLKSPPQPNDLNEEPEDFRYETEETHEIKPIKDYNKDNKPIKPLKETIFDNCEELGKNENTQNKPLAALDMQFEGRKPRHSFLKRKSQTYKPAKVEWKAKRRIDCWGETNAIEPKAKKSQKKSDLFSVISLTRVQELEFIFDGLRRSHSNISSHFGTANRIRTESMIPQIVPDSVFIVEFNDDALQEMFEALQSHYLYLCNEDEP